MIKDSLGDRMKIYECVARTKLVRRTPAIIRVDGKAFHTLTRGMTKPYDSAFIRCMQETALQLCKQIQGAQLAYVQSDEISVLLVDYQNLNSESWFDSQVQKMVSISASIATSVFTEEFRAAFFDKYAAGARPMFDSRVFNMPREEVANYFVWRQQDATRNSIQMLGQAYFSHKQLHKLSCEQIQEKLFQEHGINWSAEPTYFKRGACAVRTSLVTKDQVVVGRDHWTIDYNIPVFTQDRDYIERLVFPPEDEA